MTALTLEAVTPGEAVREAVARDQRAAAARARARWDERRAARLVCGPADIGQGVLFRDDPALDLFSGPAYEVRAT